MPPDQVRISTSPGRNHPSQCYSFLLRTNTFKSSNSGSIPSNHFAFLFEHKSQPPAVPAQISIHFHASASTYLFGTRISRLKLQRTPLQLICLLQALLIPGLASRVRHQRRLLRPRSDISARDRSHRSTGVAVLQVYGHRCWLHQHEGI